MSIIAEGEVTNSVTEKVVSADPVSFTLPNLTLHGLRGGTPGGPLLLCLHGWLDNCHSFLPLAPYLTDYDWIALDFPGHGLSDHRGADAHYYFADWVDDIASWLDRYAEQPVFLLGHSMGGYVAQTVAAVCPQRIKSVCLIEAFGLLTATETDALEQLKQALASRHRQRINKKPVYSHLQHLIKARAKAGNFSEALATLLLERNICKVEAGFCWRTDSRLRTISPYRFTQSQVSAIMRGISAPLMVIRGTTGHQELEQALMQWKALPAAVSLSEVSGGHHVHMECPEDVAALINRHFAKSQSD